MELTTNQIERFKVLYKNKYGKELSDEEASQLGYKLIQLFKPILLPEYKEVGKV